MRQYIIVALLFCGTNIISICAQNNDYDKYKEEARKEFADFKENSLKEYNDYREKANAEFASFMEMPWEEWAVRQPVPVPKEPVPFVKPPVKPDDEEDEKEIEIFYDEEINLPPPVPAPQPISIIPDTRPDPGKPDFIFKLYNTPCRVRLNNEHRFKLTSSTEKEVATIWKELSTQKYNPVLRDCIQIRTDLKLSDWGYIDLLRQMTHTFFGSQKSNEAIVMQFYILTQTGYKVRIAKADDALALLIPSNYDIFEYCYLSIDGMKYYVFDKELKNKSFRVFNQSYPKEQLLSIQIYEQPLLAVTLSNERILFSRKYPELRVSVQTNKNLIDFYDNYPLNSNWDTYSKASLSTELKTKLYPALRAAIAGKTETEAANVLINFVQTAFEYQTDEEQFGYERPFFGDETIFYPFSDCEDRSILYSILVRELMGLDVVLLHYPGHLATAVRFKSVTGGDYIMFRGEKYIICDPTYINADIGMCMPEFKRSSCKVITL